MNTVYCTAAVVAVVVVFGGFAGMLALALMILFGGYQ